MLCLRLIRHSQTEIQELLYLLHRLFLILGYDTTFVIHVWIVRGSSPYCILCKLCGLRISYSLSSFLFFLLQNAPPDYVMKFVYILSKFPKLFHEPFLTHIFSNVPHIFTKITFHF